MTSEFAWVIELGASLSRPTYWCGVDLWSTNNLDAVRFVRREDAERVASSLGCSTRMGLMRATVNGLTRTQLEAQLTSAVVRRCWWAEDTIRADLRELMRKEAKASR